MRRMLFIDIETAPAQVYTFSFFKAYIPADAIIKPGYILCVSYRWYDENKTQIVSLWRDGEEAMHQKLYDLLDEAEVVVAYNGNRFDIPWIEGELTMRGLGRPSPFHKIDLFQVWKKHAHTVINKLDYVAQRLLGDEKIHHEGFKLWVSVMNGDKRAQMRMRRYCLKDTTLMPGIYDILRPYIPNHPNMLLDEAPTAGYEEDDGVQHRCIVCGGTSVYPRGWSFTAIGRQRRYYCPDCGKWMKSPHSVTLADLRNIP
jgi:hypothetical protein